MMIVVIVVVVPMRVEGMIGAQLSSIIPAKRVIAPLACFAKCCVCFRCRDHTVVSALRTRLVRQADTRRRACLRIYGACSLFSLSVSHSSHHTFY